MRIFIYEHMTALDLGSEPGTPEHGMYLEGRAMRDALMADFGCVEGVDVFTLPDGALTGRGWDDVLRAAYRSDCCLVVAPETEGGLAQLADAVLASGGGGAGGSWLLGPSPDAIELTSDKLALFGHWRAHGVRTPATTDRDPTLCEAFPVVWKPRDGAGSVDTFLIRDRFELVSARAVRGPGRPMILQEFAPGTAVSVAFLCGPRTQAPLVPAFQRLSADGRFKYEGGELPIPNGLAERAVNLARAAVTCVPGLLGYVGVDLVLGGEPDGSRDFAVEINPRLTTSYIGLRALANFNLAEIMLRVARGDEVGALEWKPGRVRFGPEGSVTSG